MIFGCDWFKKNNVCLYFDFGFMCIDGKVYVEFKEDLYILIIVRIFKRIYYEIKYGDCILWKNK